VHVTEMMPHNAVMAGHGVSKTRVNALTSGHPRLDIAAGRKSWMPATSAGMTAERL
jgi:hypothetical protein